MIRILNVAGARPNFIKIGALHRAFEAHPELSSRLVHTGQHYDAAMSEVFFEQLELPPPDLHLGVGSDTHARQTAAVMTAFEEVLRNEQPDLVVVVGDVNSTVAASLVAAKEQIPLAHVEAGLRSFDRAMPEEINRVTTDHLANLLYVTEKSGLRNLRDEGITGEHVLFAGNVMIDSLVRFRDKAAGLNVAERYDVANAPFVLVTMHRPANVDDPDSLKTVADLLHRLALEAPVIFPPHPRTKKQLAAHDHLNALRRDDDLHLIEPLGYLEFLSLMMEASILVTDSGGVQEETTFLGVPCATVRPNTERPATVKAGTNELFPLETEPVLEATRRALAGRWRDGETLPKWDGRAAERIAEHVAQHVSSS
jgi:UDP-N-acetylglucosamine 2-epimerase (non-hydrolysing)